MCAFTAGQRGRRVALLEHREQVGKKIAISGGGRCNFTNINAGPENYLSSNPDFCKSALARYTPWDFIGLLDKHGIAYHEKKLGQQFCDGSARQIIEMLLAECAAARVDVLYDCGVRRVHKTERFVLTTNRGTMECDSLVIATGGLSFAKLGASDFGYRIAREFGLRITETRPGLVPLTFTSGDHRHFEQLSGVSLPVIARNRGVEFDEAILFTHRGLSGPAILQISSYWRENETLHLDLLPSLKGDAWLGMSGMPMSRRHLCLSATCPGASAKRGAESIQPLNPCSITKPANSSISPTSFTRGRWISRGRKATRRLR